MARTSCSYGFIRKLGCLLVVISISTAARPLQQRRAGTEFTQKKGDFRNRAAAAVQLTTVPNLVGLTASQAASALRNSHLTPGVVTTKVETRNENGIVLSQNPLPDPNKQVPIETKVNLVVGWPEIVLKLDNDHPQVGSPVTARVFLKPEIGGVGYSFDWGNGNKSSWQSIPAATSSYSIAKTYTLSVVVEVADMQLPPVKASIAVGPPPTVYNLDLEADDPVLEAGLQGTFTAKLTPTPPARTEVEYCFAWADDSAETCQKLPANAITADHIFSNPGQYHVRASAIFNTGERVSSQAVPIHVLQRPKISLVPETTFPILGEKAGFTIKVDGELPSTDPVKYCFTWEKAGQESCQEQPDAPHVFTASGIYSVSAEVEQGSRRFAAKPVAIRVYEVSLSSDLQRAEAGKPIWFEAKLVPDSLASRMEYCFHWGDGASKTCGNQRSVPHTFTARATYSNFVDISINGRTVATSKPRDVVIGTPLWLIVVIWGGVLAGCSVIGYWIKKWIEQKNEENIQTSQPAIPPVRVVPKSRLPRYEMERLKSPPKCLVRIRWVQTPPVGRITPEGNLVKKKGSAHA